MTDDFDFDFDVDRGRSGSRTQDRETEKPAETGNGRESSDPENGTPRRRSGNGNGNGSKANGGGLAAGARKLLNRRPELVYSEDDEDRGPDPKASPPPADDGDWLTFDEDDLAPPRNDETPAGPPGEARNFAKEARRRASRRPSPILDLDEERKRLEQRDTPDEGDVDFESVLSQQPQKSGIARRGSAVRNAFRGGVESLRRVGGERVAESRDRMQALKERVPTRVPQPRTAPGGDDGKPPPPRLPRRISSRRPRKPKRGRIKWFRIAIIVGGLGLLAIVSTFFGMMMAISRDLPQLENKKEFAEAKNSEVFDDQGNKLGTLLNNNQRVLAESDEISPYMKNAAVAIEDERFYEHRGVDLRGMARAGLADLIPGGSTQGASTITQQFVKNALDAQGSRTVLQKFRESALAYHLERQWDKDKILTEYLNTIYFGEGAYGIEAAARTYFSWNHPGCGQSGGDPCAKVLFPYEAAMLAGIITSPSAFSPRANPQAAVDRRNLVLLKMKDQGYIGEDEYQDGISKALPAPSDIERPRGDSLAPYFTEWLRQQVVDLYGPGLAFSGGLDVHTSLDLDMQDTAQEIAESTLAGVAPTASVVVIDNDTGGIKAMVGGNDYDNHPFNLATNGHRQPGSSFKPFTLATALSQGISAGTSYASNEKIFKVPHSKNEYFDVHNYDDVYYGSSSLETCTIHSDNSCYAELALGRTVNCVSGCGGSPAVRGGTREIARTAHKMGIDTDFSTNPSMVLGAIDPGVTPLEMAYAFSTISDDGERIGGNLDTSAGPNNKVEDLAPVAISKVVDPNGDVRSENKTKKMRVLSSGVTDTMKGILRENVLNGTGTNAQSAPNAWGKTGTTENNGDAWFCGGTDHMTACVWVGHADSTEPMETEYGGSPVDGGTYPALIWGRIMSALEDIYAEHKAEGSDKGDDSSDSTSSSDSSCCSSSSSSGSSSGSYSGGGGGGNTGGGGGGAGGPATPAPAPSGGGGTGGTGGTGL